LIAAVIVVAGAWAHAPGLGGVFLLDDVRAIARNASIRALSPLSTPLSPPTASTVAGRPVANLSLAINYALAPPDVRDAFETGPGAPPDAAHRVQRNARGYHVGNQLIHLLSALALFGVVRRTLLSERLRPAFATAAPWIAGATALLWVVHPLTTAAVTYLVQRAESLMGLFYLLTLYCAIRATEGTRAGAWTVAAVVCSGLGMGTKETMVGAPLVVAAWLWNFCGCEHLRSARTVWLLGGLASTWVVLAMLVSGEGRAPSLSLEAPTAWRYLLTQASVIVHYVGQVFVPTSLVVLYDWPLADSLSAVWPQAALLTALAGLTALGVVRRWPAAFFGAWFFLVLAPSSSVLPIVTEVAAEHRMYLPLAAVLGLLVVGAYLAGRWLETRALGALPAALGATLVLTALLGVETRARNRDYWSDETIWRDAVTKQPDYPRPRVFYGSVLLRLGRVQEAEQQFRQAVTLAPGDAMARLRLGSVLAQQRKLDEAVSQLEQVVASFPDDPGAHRLLGQIYGSQGKEALAAQHLGRALSGMGDDPDLLVQLAVLLAGSRDPLVRDAARALALAERAVTQTSRRNPLVLSALSLAQIEAGRLAEAAVTAREALQVAHAQNAPPALIRELESRAQSLDPARPR
jgi:tetratricopeptide (TPR) repeat protein